MLSRRRIVAVGTAAAILFLLIAGRVVAEVLVELWWYRSIDAEEVFWLQWGAGLAIRSGAALLIGAVVFLNLWVVTRSLGAIRVRRRFGNIEIAEQLPRSYVVLVVGLISLLSAWWLSAAFSDSLPLLAAFDHPSWGASEPILGRDLSFYVFLLPVLSGVQTILGILVFWCALLALGAYIATGSVRAQDGRLFVTPIARRHLGILLAAFLLVIAFDAWLDGYGLLIDGHGVGDSFGYTDAHARLPGKSVMVGLALAAAAAVAWGAWYGRRQPAAIGLLALLLGALGTGVVYPGLLQRLAVEPNEFPREDDYIADHLVLTRYAYDLAAIERDLLPYRADGALSAASLQRAIDGIPLWDARPLLDAYRQKQSLLTYYDFFSAHQDRYGEPGSAEQVAIAVRELEPTKLQPSAQTWQNLHLTYVSGKGVVASPVGHIADDGAPVYFLSDLNPSRLSASAPPGLRLDEPEIFFGERAGGYVIFDSERRPRGVTLDAAWKRFVFAWAFQSKNLILSDEITSESRIVYRRSAVERARAVVPFLRILADGALPVVFRGRVVWMVDAYSVSDGMPLSRTVGFGGEAVRYVRNSAKIVVDAVTGEVTVYAVAEDPILRAYSRFLPDLVRPLGELPPELARHLRYPAPLAGVQAEVLTEYHMADARAFYEKEDAWAVGTENYRSESIPAEPTYATFPLPGEERSEFVLTVPMVARGRQNLTALLVTRNDPPHYGAQRLYLLPRDQQVAGPQQVEAMVDQDPEISEQLSLWRQGGSNVIRGHLVVVPVDSTLVYVEPLYLEAETGAIPQLERVILAHDGRVVMRPSLDAAASALLGVTPAAEPTVPAEGATDRSTAPRGDATLPRLRALFGTAEAQLRAGDWAAFGRTWEAIRAALRASPPPAGAGS